jgi:Uma2 family endonuclease
MATSAEALQTTFTVDEFAAQMPNARLILSDEPQMESPEHYEQLALLTTTLNWVWREHQEFFIGANLSIYYDRNELMRRKFCGPDFFLVHGVEKAKRNSWVVWEEGGRYPDLIIELLSDSTAKTDRTGKKQLYQNIFRTPEYFWFHPRSLEFQGFRLANNHVYEAIPERNGMKWSDMLQMYLGIHEKQLRFYAPDESLIPTPTESAQMEYNRAEAEHERAEAEHKRAEAEHKRAEALAAKLRELGLDPTAS